MLKVDKSVTIWFFAGLVLFLPFLGNVSLFDGLELQLAEMAREMLVTGNYIFLQYDFQPHYETAPLFVWLQAISFKICGINEFAARLPNAILGAFLLPVIYIWGRSIFDERFGNYWTLAWMGAILPAIFLKSGMSDPLANMFSFLSIGFVILAAFKYQKMGRIELKYSAYTYAVISGFFAGLALLANGPVSLLIIYLVVLVKFMTNRFSPLLSVGMLLGHFIMALIPTGIWLVVLQVKGHTEYIKGYLLEQMNIFQTLESGIEGVPGFHFVVLILGCFPASVFALQSIFNKSGGPEYQRAFKRWMLVLLWVVVGIFTLLKMKLIHYSSLAYFPVTYLAALSMYRIVRGEWHFKPWMTRVMIGLAVTLSFIPMAAAFIAKNPHKILPFLDNRPELKQTIESEFYWFHVEYLLGPALLLVAILFVWQIHKRTAPALYWFFAGVVILTIANVAIFIGKFEKLTQQDYVIYLKQEHADTEMIHLFKDRPNSAIPLFYGKRTPNQAALLRAKGAQNQPDVIWAFRSAHEMDDNINNLFKIDRQGNFHFYRDEVAAP